MMKMKFAAAVLTIASSTVMAAPNEDGVDFNLLSARNSVGCAVDIGMTSQFYGQTRAGQGISYYRNEAIALVGNQKFAELFAEKTAKTFKEMESLKARDQNAFNNEALATGRRAQQCLEWAERKP